MLSRNTVLKAYQAVGEMFPPGIIATLWLQLCLSTCTVYPCSIFPCCAVAYLPGGGWLFWKTPRGLLVLHWKDFFAYSFLHKLLNSSAVCCGILLLFLHLPVFLWHFDKHLQVSVLTPGIISGTIILGVPNLSWLSLASPKLPQVLALKRCCYLLLQIHEL